MENMFKNKGSLEAQIKGVLCVMNWDKRKRTKFIFVHM